MLSSRRVKNVMKIISIRLPYPRYIEIYIREYYTINIKKQIFENKKIYYIISRRTNFSKYEVTDRSF